MATLPKLPGGKLKNPASSRTVPRKTIISCVTQREPVAATKAKAHFLQLLDQVERDRIPIRITKRGRVVAQISPAPEAAGESTLESMVGRLKGTIKITGDIVSPDHAFWGPNWR